MVKVSTGYYVEILKAEISYDGDYLYGKVTVRVISNGMDNIQSVGYGEDFIQGIDLETVKSELIPNVKLSLKEQLKQTFNFTDLQLSNLRFNYSYTN